MRTFKITAKSGEYKVSMRGSLAGITNEKALIVALQKTCDSYKAKEGWERYGEKCQSLLDERDYFELHSLWAMFGQSRKV